MGTLKTQVVQITDEGRDKGKVFLLTEMPARQAEEWAYRLFLALARADIPDEISQAGMAGVAQLSFKVFGGMHWQDAKPLLDEMFTCVRITPDLTKSEFSRALIDDDIEEVQTRMKLRWEVLQLHAGFFIAAIQLRFGKPNSATDPAASKNTATSPEALLQ
jgi:hypothetical protein